MKRCVLVCVLCVSVVSLQAQEALTADENKRLDALSETWQRFRAPLEELERDPKVQRYLALVQLRVDVQKDLEAFAQKVVTDRKLRPGEAFLDLQSRKVVKKQEPEARSLKPEGK